MAPAFRTGGGPYWQGFIVKAPYNTYVNYGDRTLFRDHYDDMKLWLDFIERHSADGILQPWPDTDSVSSLPFGRDHRWFLADWAVPDGVDKGGESILHANSCFIAECLSNMEHMALMLHRTDDAQRFAARRQRIIESIHRHFFHPASHSYANGTPLDQCYALLLGIPPDSTTAAAVKTQLLSDIHTKYRDHVAFGLMGTPIFTEWCIRNRQTDLMATILRQPDYPGYLNMMETPRHQDVETSSSKSRSLEVTKSYIPTTWESWDCGRPGKEDRSRVHNCYNGIGIWFYQALAGIRPDTMQGGYKHFYVDPQPCSGVEWLRATKPTPFGDIRVEIRNSELLLTIPSGTTATIFPGTPREQTLPAGEWKVMNDE